MPVSQEVEDTMAGEDALMDNYKNEGATTNEDADDGSFDDDDDSEGEDDDISSDEDDDSSVDEEELEALEAMYAQAEQAKARLQQEAQKEWNALLEGLKRRQNSVLKMTNGEPNLIRHFTSDVDKHLEDLLVAVAAAATATPANGGGGRAVLTHVNLGKAFLESLDETRQKRFFQQLFTQHAKTLAYICLLADEPLGPADNRVHAYTSGIIHTHAWLDPLVAACRCPHTPTLLTETEENRPQPIDIFIESLCMD